MMRKATTSAALLAVALSTTGVSAQASGSFNATDTVTVTASASGSATGSAGGSFATVQVFPVGFEDGGLQGEILGTGSDGTTYALSGTYDPGETDATAVTMTLVEDATHVSLTAFVPIDTDLALGVDVQCSIPADAALLGAGAAGACTQIISAPGTLTTGIFSGGVDLTPVVVNAGTFSVDTASATLTHSVSTLSGGSSSTSLLGATLITGTTSAGTGTGSSTAVGGSGTGIVVGSGGVRGVGSGMVTMAGMVLGTVASVLAGAFVVYL